MPNINGSAYSASDNLKRAPGTSVDAGERHWKNVFTLATEGGGTTNPLLAAKVREGNIVTGIEISSDQNLAGINFSAGVAGAAAKYAAAQAGPAANTTKQLQLTIAALAATESLGAVEEIILTPSGALPASGTIVVTLRTTKR